MGYPDLVLSSNESIQDTSGINQGLIQEDPTSFPLSWEVFCAEVAMGVPASTASVSAGYSKVYADDLVQRQDIKDRISYLVKARFADGGIASKLWAELRLVQITEACMETVEPALQPDGTITKRRDPDYPLAVTAINSLAKLKGWIIDKKQSVNAKVDFGSANVNGTLTGMLDAALGELSPEQASRVRELTQPKPGRTRRASRTVDATPGK